MPRQKTPGSLKWRCWLRLAIVAISASDSSKPPRSRFCASRAGERDFGTRLMPRCTPYRRTICEGPHRRVVEGRVGRRHHANLHVAGGAERAEAGHRDVVLAAEAQQLLLLEVRVQLDLRAASWRTTADRAAPPC